MSQSEGPFSGDSAVPQPKSGLTSSALFVSVMPPLFVFLWATGFVFTKLGMPYVEPIDRKSTRLNSSHSQQSRMPSSA